ncbi:hypothetical protein HDU96_010376 [Phlyctochytrium bullatum]|nr:hypothetical protein HDU96_010376 [Phlyctochytrium bullatum]
MGNQSGKHLSEDVEGDDVEEVTAKKGRPPEHASTEVAGEVGEEEGRGARHVRIVEKRDTRKLYALKYINKDQCVRMRAIQNIFRERAILEEISHPYIVNLRYAFQDDDNMFMVLDLMMGGDLRYHLDRIGGFREDAVRVMAGELALALHYLHRNKIVHRDLKPDNILLDEAGHVHLTDFNIAVKYVGRNTLKSHSGTLAYMAPEIFADTGYLWQVDWWSLGVCIFECLFGKRPFRGNSNEALTAAIRKQSLSIPEYNLVTKQPLNLSRDCVSFLRGLLERNVERRLGSQGFETIKEHPWLAVLDWQRLERKEVGPMFVPEPDRSNFDASYDLEELLLEEKPLKYKPRRKKPAKADPNAPGGSPSDGASVSAKLGFGRKKPVSAQSAQVTQGPTTSAGAVPMFDPRAMGRNRSVGAALQPNHNQLFGNNGFASAGAGAGIGASGAVDRVTAELQFIEENFRTYDFTQVAREKARAKAAAAAAAAAAANDPSIPPSTPGGPSSAPSVPPLSALPVEGIPAMPSPYDGSAGPQPVDIRRPVGASAAGSPPKVPTGRPSTSNLATFQHPTTHFTGSMPAAPTTPNAAGPQFQHPNLQYGNGGQTQQQQQQYHYPHPPHPHPQAQQLPTPPSSPASFVYPHPQQNAGPGGGRARGMYASPPSAGAGGGGPGMPSQPYQAPPSVTQPPQAPGGDSVPAPPPAAAAAPTPQQSASQSSQSSNASAGSVSKLAEVMAAALAAGGKMAAGQQGSAAGVNMNLSPSAPAAVSTAHIGSAGGAAGGEYRRMGQR